MRNAYPQPDKPVAQSTLQAYDDTDWDAGLDSDVISLLEENARLRALVVRLSDLVLKSVVEQK